jgi:hypothetical protein
MTDDVRDDVRTTSDALIKDALVLAELERRKADPEVSDAELEELATRSHELTIRMADKARIEKKLVELANDD